MRTFLQLIVGIASITGLCAQTTPSSTGATQAIPARILYREVFRHVVFLDQAAASVRERGKDPTTLDRFYEKHAKLTAAEAASLKQAARAVEAALKRVDSQIKAEVLQYRAQLPRGRITAGTPLPALPSSLVDLQREKDDAVLQQIALLQAAMGAGRFSQFDAWVQRDMSRHVQVATVAPPVQSSRAVAPRAAPTPPNPSLREVVGVSRIETPYDGYNQEVVSYSATDVGAEVAANFDSGVEAQVWVGGSPGQYRNYSSWGDTSVQITSYPAPDTIYRIETTHYLLARVCETPEMGGCWKPLTFTPTGGSDWGYRVFSGWSNEINPYGDVPYVYLGTTKWEIDTTHPYIEGVYMCDPPGTSTPASAVLGASGCFEIRGHHLTAAGDDPQPDVGVTGTGVAVSGCSGSDVRLICNYSVANSAQPLGTHDVVVTTYAGPSSRNGTITIGDPTPVIEMVTPSQWYASQEYGCSIQIRGSGFGTNPTVTVASADDQSEILYASASGCAPPTRTLITMSVRTSRFFRPGSVRITVRSNGYEGTSFAPAQTGQPNSVAELINLIGITPLPPVLAPRDGAGVSQCSMTNWTGTVRSAVVGQKLALTACLPAGFLPGDVSTANWVYPTELWQYAVGGYNPSATNNQQVVPIALPPVCNSSYSTCDFPVFYPVAPNPNAPSRYELTYRYTFANNGPTLSSTVTFSVSGPTPTGIGGALLTADVQMPPIQTFPFQIVNVWRDPVTGIRRLGFGAGPTIPGIGFFVAATPPPTVAGTFQFVQTVNYDVSKYLTRPSVNSGDPVIRREPPTGLDNWYPYPTAPGANNQAADAPGQDLTLYDRSTPPRPTNDPLGEAARHFTATMYLMWDPTLPGTDQATCHAADNLQPAGQPPGTSNPRLSTCTGSIPVPLGLLTWGYSADAINTLDLLEGANGSTWLISCGSPFAPAWQPNSEFRIASYPRWSAIFRNQ